MHLDTLAWLGGKPDALVILEAESISRSSSTQLPYSKDSDGSTQHWTQDAPTRRLPVLSLQNSLLEFKDTTSKDEWAEVSSRTTACSESRAPDAFEFESKACGAECNEEIVQIAVSPNGMPCHGHWELPAKRWQIVGTHAVLVQRKAHSSTWAQTACAPLAAPYQRLSTRSVSRILNHREALLDRIRKSPLYREANFKCRNSQQSLPPSPRPCDYLSDDQFEIKLRLWYYLLKTMPANHATGSWLR